MPTAPIASSRSASCTTFPSIGSGRFPRFWLKETELIARQIRSDTRMIGTLRAVGADLKTLVGCYRLPVWICAGVAMIPCLLFYAVSGIPALRLFTVSHPLIMIPILAVLAGCVALACTAGIRGRLAGVARQPIVENIREL